MPLLQAVHVTYFFKEGLLWPKMLEMAYEDSHVFWVFIVVIIPAILLL